MRYLVYAQRLDDSGWPTCFGPYETHDEAYAVGDAHFGAAGHWFVQPVELDDANATDFGHPVSRP